MSNPLNSMGENLGDFGGFCKGFGLPEIEEVYAHLDEWHNQWWQRAAVDKKGMDFWSFIRTQMYLPMPYWHLNWQGDEEGLLDAAVGLDTDEPNAWFTVMNHLYADRYQTTIDEVMQQETGQDSYGKDEASEVAVAVTEVPAGRSVWVQHQRMMFEAACNHPHYKAFEILQMIPLNHEDWTEDAKIYFKLNQLSNVYQAFKIIKMAQHDFSQRSRQLIRKYIDEVKYQIQASKEDNVKTD